MYNIKKKDVSLSKRFNAEDVLRWQEQANLTTDGNLILWMENALNNTTNKQNVSGSLFSDEEIREGADEWVFEINGMKWSNNDGTAGDNFGSFVAGAKWIINTLKNNKHKKTH